jgi:hypothetical protein
MEIGKKIDSLTIFLVVLILVGVMAIYFLGGGILQNDAAAADVEANIQSEYIRRERYSNLLSTYHEIISEEIHSELDTLLPGQENFLDIVKELEDLAVISGTQITMRLGDAKLTSEGVELETGTSATPPSVQAGGNNYDFIEIEAVVRGSYTNFLQFINVFRQSKYFMNISDIVINRIVTGETRYIDSQLTIHIFVEKLIRVRSR